jgi:adenine-specific DNA-methyltransferase
MKGGVAEFSERPLSLIPFRRIDWNDDREVLFHNSIVHEFTDAVNRNQLNELGLNSIHEKIRSFIY